MLAMFFLVNAGTALACQCIPVGGASVCHRSTPGETVFVGTVTKVDEIHHLAGLPFADGSFTITYQYQFRVDEKIAATNGTEAEVSTGNGGGDCGYPFELGSQYLVFAYREKNGQLSTSICTSTQPLTSTQAILPQLRAMRDRRPVASVYGLLQTTPSGYYSPDVSDEPFATPLPNRQIELRSATKHFISRTDAEGAYAFYSVPAGKYDVSADLPPHTVIADLYNFTPPRFPVKLPSDACYELNITAYPTGRIQGSVFDAEGKPIEASVTLFKFGKYRSDSSSGWSVGVPPGGFFKFDHVGPGEYIIAFNNDNYVDSKFPFPRCFYPGVPDIANARPIHLDPGQHISNANIQVGNLCAAH